MNLCTIIMNRSTNIMEFYKIHGAYCRPKSEVCNVAFPLLESIKIIAIELSHSRLCIFTLMKHVFFMLTLSKEQLLCHKERRFIKQMNQVIP